MGRRCALEKLPTMTTLSGKKILLAVSGSIAAYKTAPLVRLLIKSGAEVQVIMTAAAKGFITPLTLSTLSKHPVWSDVHSGKDWNNHVELGLWADAMLVAPATANTLAKMANGLCDNLLLAVYLSSRCPVFVAPAMDLDMWVHPSTQANIQRLQSYGNHLLPVEEGELASGLVGKGRMAEPETILDHLKAFFTPAAPAPLVGKRVLVSAGATQEAIDPVRYLTNHSTGTMGAALATVLLQQGAEVIFLKGKTAVAPPTHPSLQVHGFTSAADLHQLSVTQFPKVDVAILAAAVADYTPTTVADQKVKKQGGDWQLTLQRTVDIAATLGQQKRADQLLIGFALETQQALSNAQGKLKRKNFDAIVLNDLSEEGAGFGTQTNRITILEATGGQQSFPVKPKIEVAQDIVQKIIDLLEPQP